MDIGAPWEQDGEVRPPPARPLRSPPGRRKSRAPNPAVALRPEALLQPRREAAGPAPDAQSARPPARASAEGRGLPPAARERRELDAADAAPVRPQPSGWPRARLGPPPALPSGSPNALSDRGCQPRGSLLPAAGQGGSRAAHPHVLRRRCLGSFASALTAGTWHTHRFFAPAPGAPGTAGRASPGRWRSSLASRAR